MAESHEREEGMLPAVELSRGLHAQLGELNYVQEFVAFHVGYSDDAIPCPESAKPQRS